MSMFSFNRSVISGGNFMQVNNIDAQSRALQILDRLQAAGAPAALHNSAERFDPPRCHPNTRVAIMDELIDWVIRRGSGGHARVLWLSGPAGAGKSAIAQSLCEICFSHKFLLASFIFNRSDSSRNNSKRFVATITSQIYGMVPRQYQSLILDVIGNDPHVFDRSIEAQFKALIMDPLRDLFEADHFNNYDAPRLIVIDGLDECSPRAAQVNILKAVQTISEQRSSPFVFLIASRPEHDIQMFFRRFISLGPLIRRIDLDDSYDPELDIARFFEDKFRETCTTHPLKESIPQGWPPSRTIEKLAQKSSGQFVYASVVVKYVTSDRHYPPNRLEVVLGLRPPRRDLPFAELDILYSHILSCVEDVTLVLQIFRIQSLFQKKFLNLSAKDVEQLCDLDQGGCLNALCDLQSVVQIRPPEQEIVLLHKSLSDYLQDPSRSQKYHIDTTPRTAIPVVMQCFRVLYDPNLDYNDRCADFVIHNYSLLVKNVPMCHEDLMSFSLMRIHQTHSTMIPSRDFGPLDLSLSILDDVCLLKGGKYDFIYWHHLQQYPELIRHYPKIYEAGTPGHNYYLLAMILSSVLLGNSESHIPSQVFDMLQPLGSLSWLQVFDIAPHGAYTFPNLYYAVARRCINSLIHDQHSNSATFALECLDLVLPYSKVSADLNDACRLLHSSLDYSSTGGSLAYDFMRRPYAEMGHSVTEIHRTTEVLEYNVREAMQQYMERYSEEEISSSSSNDQSLEICSSDLLHTIARLHSVPTLALHNTR